MRKSEVGKRYFAKIAICLLMVAGLSISTAYAAENTKGALTLTIPETGTYAEALKDVELTANLYKVAEVNAEGAFTIVETYKDALAIDNTEWSQFDWSQSAAAVADIVTGENSEADESAATTVTADKTVKITNSATVEDLVVGMYLVMVDEVTANEEDYVFSPMLVCLPTNPYVMGFSEDEADNKNWYEVTATLKPALDLEYGKLEIQKTLSSYNTSLKDVTFVFQIEAKDEAGNVIYSNVASTTHNAAGTKSAIVEGVPIGVELTVTEVYSGASYTVSGDSVKTATVLSVEEMGKVEFTNTYDDKLIPGYGVVNNFEYNEEGEDAGWTWTQLTDNSQANE